MKRTPGPRLEKRRQQIAIGKQIIDKQERAATLMRTAAAIQAEAMMLMAEIAVLSAERNS